VQLTDRTAEVLVVLTSRDFGLTLAQIAEMSRAPLSSVQRTVASLHRDGIVVKLGGRHPIWRLAPDAPAAALADLASWRLAPARTREIRQQVSSMADVPGSEDVAQRMATALRDPELAQRLQTLASRLIWWQQASETLLTPERLIAQAMAIGTSDDTALVRSVFGDDAMRQVLASSPAGVFGARAWDYWHLRLGYAHAPTLPTRDR